jgi:Spx/MgsR family transcriptional regulator
MPRKATPTKAAAKKSSEPRRRAAGAKKTSEKSARGKSVQFLQKPSCTSCRNARAYMEKRGFDLHFRDLDKQRLSAAELEELIGDRDHKEFLNTRNELYRAKNMKQNPPSRAEAIRMMAETPNLIRRPVIIAGGRIVLGFDQNGIDGI